MKKFLIALIVLLTLVTSNMVFAAVIPIEVELNQNLTITYNGEIQRFKNVKGDIVYPLSYQGTTYLPIRSISCLFETEIEWDGNTNSIYLGKGALDTIAAESISEFLSGTNQNIMVDLNQDIKIYHNGVAQTFKDVNGKVVYPLSYQGTTYLPVRAISNLYNASIEWIGETSTVVINKKNDIPVDSNAKMETFEITGYSNVNGNVNYAIYIEDANKYVYINATDFNLPDFLYDYREHILFNVNYSLKNYKVQSCNVINATTKVQITDLSEANFRRLFDIEYGQTVINKSWVDKISLAELTPNTIYQYTATSTVQIPQIVNNTGKDCAIYTKEHDDSNYQKEINLCNNIQGNAASFTYNEFEPGETLTIMYKTLTTDELLSQINEDEIIRLSAYKTGDELVYGFEDYIYNDTTRNITLEINDNAFGMAYTETVTVEAGRIYGFSWMIDSVKVK